MKKLLFAAFLFLITGGFAQQVIPMDKYDDLYKRNVLRHKIYSLKNSAKSTALTTDQQGELQNAVDSLRASEDKVFIYGYGASDAVSLGNVTASGGFSFGAQLHPWDRFFLSVGIGGNVVKKEKQDSVNINSIFFPDNASSVVNGHYELSVTNACRLWKYKNNKSAPTAGDNLSDDLILFVEGSLQNRNIEAVDSSVHNFGIFNLATGIKYRWMYDNKGKNKFCFDIAAAYGYIEIAQQSKKSFQTLVEPDVTAKPNVPTIYRGLNFIATVQYNDLIIYARIFTPVSVNGAVAYEHNTFFSTGIKVTGTFFSF